MKLRCCGCMRLKEIRPICEHCGWDERKQNDPHQLPIGTVLENKYVVGRILGQGGFGITYIGWDTVLDIPVAIKEYFPVGVAIRDSAVSTQISTYGGMAHRFCESRERFLREARALARFSDNDRIVHVYSCFQANNTAYIVMEFVEGITLRDYVKEKGKLTREETLHLLMPMVKVLQQVHEEGVIHRDISPDNIMLVLNSKAKLLDFGAVRDFAGAEAGKDLSKSTQAILKQGYAPLEQYRGKGDLGPWTDVYALCATIVYCLTGKRPPDAPERAMGEEEIRFAEITAGDESLGKALERGMALRAMDRTRSMEQLWQEVFSDGGERDHRKLESAQEKKRQKSRKRRLILPLILLALAGMATVVIWKLSLIGQLLPLERTDVEVIRPTEASIEPTYENKVRVFGGVPDTVNDIPRSQITDISFCAYGEEIPDTAVDVSREKDHSVLAWVRQTEGEYHLIVAAEGIVYAPTDCSELFADMKALRRIDFSGWDTAYVSNMEKMFFRCSQLQALNVSGWDTSRVRTMAHMFDNCTELKTLDVSGWDTGKVFDLSYMFYKCIGLEKLNVDDWDTGNVTNMAYMFDGCQALHSLDVSRWDTENVVYMINMFYNCKALQELNVSRWNTRSVVDTGSMFSGCESLKVLDVRSWDTGNITKMGSMFSGCSSLEQLEVGSWNVVNVTNTGNMFYECARLEALDVGNWNTGKVTNMAGMFANCRALSFLNLQNWDTSNVMNVNQMFWNSDHLQTLELNWDVSRVLTSGDFMSTKGIVNGQSWREFFPK